MRSQKLTITDIFILLMVRLKEVIKPRYGYTLLMDSLEEIGLFSLVFEQNTHMVIVASHKEAVEITEGRFASQKYDI